MSKRIKILLAIFVFCILCNFPPLSIVFHVFTNEGYYQYSNYDGANTTEQGLFKNGDFGRIKRVHQFWLDANPTAPDVFWKNPFAFW